MEFSNNEVISNNESEPGEMKDGLLNEQNLSAAYVSVYSGVVANNLAIVGSEDSESLHSVEEVLGDLQNSEEVFGDPEQSEENVGGQDQPPLHGQDQPPLHGQDQPPLHGQDQPPLHGQDQPPLHGQDQSPLHGQDQPPLHGQDQPPLNGQDQSPLHGQDQSPLHGQDQPPLHGQDQPPLHGMPLHAMQAMQHVLDGMDYSQPGNRIAQPPEVAQFHASLGHPPGLEVVDFLLSKLLYNMQLLRDQEYPFCLRAFANSMWLMDMHMKNFECVPMVLFRLLFLPDRVNKWLELDLFCVHVAKFLYLRSKGRGTPEMIAAPLYPIYKEDLADLFRLHPRYT